MTDLPIEDYDLKPVEVLMDEFHRLNRAELFRIENYERQHQNRGIVLESIRTELRGPMDGYDDLSEPEIVDQLDNYCSDDLEAIMNYERNHKRRKGIMEAINAIIPAISC
jgi:hypothetical protein